MAKANCLSSFVMIKRLARWAHRIYQRDSQPKDDDGVLLDEGKSLERLLIHAYQHVPYYRKAFDKINLMDQGKPDLSRFDQIPFLTKKNIRDNYDFLVSDDLPLRGGRLNTSGGSTGEPIQLVQCAQYRQYRRLTQKYYYKKFLMIDEDDTRKVILWGSEQDIFKAKRTLKDKFLNWITNTVFLNSFRMSEADMRRYVEIINDYRPVLLRGYAGSLYQLSLFVERSRLDVHAPKFIISSAETLHNNMRSTIERIWKTKIYDYYGSREVNGMAGECQHGSMHIFSFWNHVEILNDHNESADTGEPGRIIVTNLYNYSMPLIRYEIGDMAVRESLPCGCGQSLPMLEKIIGRITDHFVKKDRTLIHGEFFTHLFYGKSWVQKFQVIQEDYDRIVIKIVSPDGIPSLDRQDIETKIRIVMGNECCVTWDPVQEIALTAGGKYLYTKSLVHQSR